MPMTDQDIITRIFMQAGIGCCIEPTRSSHASVNSVPLPRGMTLTAARNDTNTVRHFGYLGFYAELYFDNDGALVGIGAWE
jgi:hypothetical protein